ncbi:MAG: glycogen synthase GlgA [Clostridia bacterium]
MKILFVAAEAIPFVKTGGLADVAGSLPKSLIEEGLDVAVILPKYQDIPEKFVDKMQYLLSFNITIGQINHYCGIFFMKIGEVNFYFIDNEYLYQRPGLYGYWDDGERFAFYVKAALDFMPLVNFKADIIHCHDWHSAMLPVLLVEQYKKLEYYKNMKSVLTIHNLKFQGIFTPDILKLFGLSFNLFNTESLEFFGNINYLKGGIFYADKVTTVSKNYAEEICQEEYGEGIDGVLSKIKDKIEGIVNGIDTDIYNPKTDKSIVRNYTIRNFMSKVENKRALQAEFNLEVDESIPLFTMISRLTDQKGLDIFLPILDEFLQKDVQLFILGTGEKKYEEILKDVSRSYPNKFFFCNYFNESLAHKIYAAGDFFFMPSRFEPCGLGQLIAMRYGNIPIVRETGGLKDTVEAINIFTQKGTGITFAKYSKNDLREAIKRSLELYEDKKLLLKIAANAMKKDYSWKQSAKKYLNIYSELVE